MGGIQVLRLAYDTPVCVGHIDRESATFAYDPGYLAKTDSVPLSLSLPLRAEPYDAPSIRPYFEGLLAEGAARQALAAELGLAVEDYLGLLVACGKDCIGDVLVLEASDTCETDSTEAMGYAPVSPDELSAMFGSYSEAAEENAASRLSLAGTQNKVGLAHDPSASPSDGWLRPRGLAATTHILKTSYLRDIPEIEYLCMRAARICGIAVPDTFLIAGHNPVLAVSRFDRVVQGRGTALQVRRVHQEDMSQAFGIQPGSKYAELVGGSVASIARLIKRFSTQPARDLSQFARTLLFNYAIGNCDAHLKNYSIELVRGADGRVRFRLAPMYDLVCTTRYPRFSRNLAMSIGGAQTIDDVDTEQLEACARDLGVTTKAVRNWAEEVVENVASGIEAAGEGACGEVFESTPYVAEDLIEDMLPRLEVLRSFCSG